MESDTLSKEEAALFYRLKHLLYLYANRNLHMLRDSDDWRSIYKEKLENIMKVRNHVFIKNRRIIDVFVQENPFSLSEGELAIVQSWKEAKVLDKAILYKYEPQHTLFLHKGVMYGVKGLMDSFRELFGNHAPFFIDLVILPFKEILVHEGLCMPYRVIFGKGLERSVLAEAEETILKRGIMVSFSKSVQTDVSDIDLLRFYMKSERNRDQFYGKIESLRKKSPELASVYAYETGRISAKQIRADLQKKGLQGHFAILSSQVIASGATETELRKNLAPIVGDARISEVYTFRLAGNARKSPVPQKAAL